jgi:lysophospholipase L1-like esterase
VDDDVDAFRLCYRHKSNDGQALTADEIKGVYLYQYIDIYERLDNLSAVKIDIGNAKTLINTGLLKPDVQIIDRYNDANVADATRVFSGTVTYENDYLQWVTPSSEVSSAFSIALYGTTATMVAEYVQDANVAEKLTLEFDYDFNGTGAIVYCSNYSGTTKQASLDSGQNKHAKLQFDVTSVKTLSISLADKTNNLSKTLKIKNLLLYYGTANVQLETGETQTTPYRKMLSIGDSLTNGCLWQSYAARVIGVKRYTRAGGSGGTISTAGTLPIYNAVNALTSDLGYDLITFWGGTNDWSQSIELGTFEDNIDINERDTTTFYGALIGCIEKLTTLYPTARIVMIGTTPRASNNGVATYHNSQNSRNLYLSDYVDAVKKVADYFGCPFLDLLNTSGINDVNISSWMQAQDNGHGQIYYLHFNNWATEKIGRRIGAFVRSLGY